MKIKPTLHRGRVTVELDRKDESLLERAGVSARIQLKQVLVPIDFSEFSYKALEYAKAFASEFKAEITLLHVVPLNYAEVELAMSDYASIEKECRDYSLDRLNLLQTERLGKEIVSRVEVRSGRPVQEIIAFAEEKEMDLIIMSTHGYTGLRHVLLGSTTENVVRYARCPVMTVRQHEHDFIKRSL